MNGDSGSIEIIGLLDIGLIAILILSALLAYFRGFVHEVLAIAGWIGALLAAIFITPPLLPIAKQTIGIDWVAVVATAGAIFLITLIGLSILTHIVSKKVRDSALNSIDRALGFLFGLLRGAFFVILALIVANWVVRPENRPDWMANSRLLPFFDIAADGLTDMMPTALLEQLERDELPPESAPENADDSTVDKLSQPETENRAPESPGYRDEQREALDQLIENTK